ncbi:MAG: hypothetical protein EDM79_12620 [Chloroflexi bacterium]|nr:MAG: hypothetical protein EDM79_12620 [Chloroflexota bacterium]
MQVLQFLKTVTMDHSNLLENLVALLRDRDIQFCVIGGQAVNAYVEPLVSLDLDLVVAVHQIERVESLLEKQFTVKRFPHSLNISIPGSDVRVQVHTDARYASFLERASTRTVVGMELPVANVEDVLQGKSGRFRIPSAVGANDKRTSRISHAFWNLIQTCDPKSRRKFSPALWINLCSSR